MKVIWNERGRDSAISQNEAQKGDEYLFTMKLCAAAPLIE